MSSFRYDISAEVRPDRTKKLLDKTRRRKTGLGSKTQNGDGKRITLETRGEEFSISGHDGSGKISQARAQETRFGDLSRVAGQICFGDGFVSGVGRVEEIPGEHLAHFSVDEEFRCVGDAEEGELPV